MIVSPSQVVRIRLAGEFDFSIKDKLTKLLLQATGADAVILDLSGTTYLDAAALGCLIVMKNRLRPGGTVHLLGLRRHIRKTFSVTGLDKVFKVSETFEDFGPGTYLQLTT
ncbi:MAG: STAS domain-containing protein [Vulcanimicrobiaceae bacterium]